MIAGAHRQSGLTGRIDTVMQVLVGLILLAMVCLNVVNALGRYLLGQSLTGADEILVFSMVWLVFLGMPLIAAKRDHLGFGWLSQRLPRRGSILLLGILDLYICVLCGWLAYQSVDFVERIVMINQKSMSAGIPMMIPHSAITFAMIATAIVCAWRGVTSLIQVLNHGRGGAA